MSYLSIEKERQAYNAILAAHTGSSPGLTTSLEQQLYALLMGEGGGSGSGGCGCGEGNTFSPDEQVWGTWVDGKTIYRKIFTDIAYTSTGGFTNGNIDVSALNIDKVLRIEGIRDAGNKGSFYPMSANAYAYIASSGELRGSMGAGGASVVAGTYVWIALYYTKADGTAGESASV